jgi:hypothetical protein
MFGFNSITPQAAAWMKAPVTRNVTIQEQVISGYVSGPTVRLPAGAVSVVIGVEDRKDSSSEIWDSLTNLGSRERRPRIIAVSSLTAVPPPDSGQASKTAPF